VARRATWRAPRCWMTKHRPLRGAGSLKGRTPTGCGNGCHRHPHTSGCHYRKGRHMSTHTHLVCMRCGHMQPVPRDQLPSRCENCRESFAAHGYFLHDDTTDAEEVSQDVLDTRAISRVSGASR
jgi:hypothetical protein